MKQIQRKVIVSCAITGAIHTPTLSKALPYTPEDIARQAIDAADAGAAILHLHARNPQDAHQPAIRTCLPNSCLQSRRGHRPSSI